MLNSQPNFKKEVYAEAIIQALFGIKLAMHGSNKKNEFNYNITEDKIDEQ